MKSADLRRYALNLLKLSKKFLLEDGDLDPTAFILTADDQLLRPIELNDESGKLESCMKIVDEARRKNAKRAGMGNVSASDFIRVGARRLLSSQIRL